jgi:hypothetical protein
MERQRQKCDELQSLLIKHYNDRKDSFVQTEPRERRHLSKFSDVFSGFDISNITDCTTSGLNSTRDSSKTHFLKPLAIQLIQKPKKNPSF